MLAEGRRLAIKGLVEEEGIVKVADLGKILNVSEVTIRRDLDIMEKDNSLQRVHGGAIVAEESDIIKKFFDRRSQEHWREKRRIGEAGAELIKDGDVVIMDAGTTTFEMAKNLGNKKNLTVVTNALNIAMKAFTSTEITGMMTGGIFKQPSLSLTGPTTAESLKDLNADMFFLSVQGISVEKGITNASISDIFFKKAAMKAAREVIVVADSSKFGKVKFCTISPLSAIHKIITDSKVPKETVEELESCGIEVIIV